MILFAVYLFFVTRCQLNGSSNAVLLQSKHIYDSIDTEITLISSFFALCITKNFIDRESLNDVYLCSRFYSICVMKLKVLEFIHFT